MPSNFTPAYAASKVDSSSFDLDGRNAQLSAIFVTIVVAIVVGWNVLRHQHDSKKKLLPPGPWGVPVLGMSLAFSVTPR